jgi:hypothetical protein
MRSELEAAAQEDCMTDAHVVSGYLRAEAEALAPFDFVTFGPTGKASEFVALTRREDGKLEVRVPGRPSGAPPLAPAVRSALQERGFVSSDAADPLQPWAREVADAASGVELAVRVLREVFEVKPDAALDLLHGSHRIEHEARQRLAQVRQRIERVLGDMGKRPEQDEDGDYFLSQDDVRIFVAPRIAPGGPTVVRVFAITNVAIAVTPELGLFLARLNFGLTFGRFALDVEHQSIWFDETVLGDQFSDEELRLTIQLVASTADQWDDRLKQMCGGATYQEVLSGRSGHAAPPTKPGEGGYL